MPAGVRPCRTEGCQGFGVAVGVGVGLRVGHAATQLCDVSWHDCSVVCSVWLHGSTHACAPCNAVLQALPRGLVMHVCRAVVTNALQFVTHPCATVSAFVRHVCKAERQPLTHCGSGWLGTELAHAVTQVCLSL